MKLFVVTMHRWGSTETHNYVLGVYNTISMAIHQGVKHEQWRGGKYEHKITEVIVDETLYRSEE